MKDGQKERRMKGGDTGQWRNKGWKDNETYLNASPDATCGQTGGMLDE